jgi:hypothetical protein
MITSQMDLFMPIPPDLDRPPPPLDQRTPLEIALEPGPLPWPQSLEENIRETSRRIEAQAAQPWPADCGNCRSMLGLVADPITERQLRPRKERETSRILDILDSLERSGS